MTTDTELRERREAIVLEHMASEDKQDYEATLATFSHPRYEIVATGEIFDGEEQVRQYYETTYTAFPDQLNELVILYHAEDAVIVELNVKGTHKGELRGIKPSGKTFTCRTAAFFIFEDDKLLCERVYFDLLTMLVQLGLITAAPQGGG